MSLCQMRKIAVVGCGYVGQSLLRLLLAGGADATGFTRTEPSAMLLQAKGLPVHGVDILGAKLGPLESSWDSIFFCASSGRGGIDSYRQIFLEGTRRLLGLPGESHFIFTSSTSVYPQRDGSWVDEDTLVEPDQETGRILRQTEGLVIGRGGKTVRLAGIYGPHRCVPLRKLLSGEAVLEEGGHRWMNHIHRDDAANALLFLNERSEPGVFNCTDNQPATQYEWFDWVCSRLQAPLPPEGPRDPRRKRPWTSKRVSNAKLRRLGWSPKYPSFREGIEHLWAAELER